MTTVYEITDEDREKLREPLGDVVQNEELITELQSREYHRLICVGDRVSLDVAESAVDADISIVDGRIEREAIDTDAHETIDAELVLDVENPAGVITEEAWNTVRKAFAHTSSTTVDVDGEEDLLALPAILFASPDSLIVYGDWQNGAVIMEPDDELKRFARELVGYKQYPRVIVGGSWDHFHAGHRYILLAAFEHGEHVDIGVTTDEMLAAEGKSEDDALEGFETRKAHIESFVAVHHLEDHAAILPIDDFRGNAVDADAAVLMVTEDTLENGKKVNDERLEQRKTPLNLAVLERITGEDGDVISSSRIRRDEIDENGFVL